MGSCIRCQKHIDKPGFHTETIKDIEGNVLGKNEFYNADYIIAEDTVGTDVELRLFQVKHTESTLSKSAGGEPVNENEYDRVDVTGSVPEIDEKHVRFEQSPAEITRQKTGIICPDCFNPETDYVIWGFHKGQGRKLYS